MIRKTPSRNRKNTMQWLRRDNLIGAGEKMQKSGNPLQALRARQMVKITAQGSIKWEIPKLTLTVLERIVFYEKAFYNPVPGRDGEGSNCY